MPICQLDHYKDNSVDHTKLKQIKEFSKMPVIPNTKNDHISDKVQNLHLTEMKGPKQTTSDGTTPLNSASGDGNSNAVPNGESPEKNWSDELKEGMQPDPSDDQNEEDGESSEEDSSDEDSSGEEEIKAPLELMGEFLQYVRTSDWENASKLCKMILIYEPENPEALQFQSVIAEKAQVEKELAEMSSSSDEDEESSSEDEETDEEEQHEKPDDDTENHKDDQDSPDEFEPRPGSKMKNKLIFPHLDPVWKP